MSDSEDTTYVVNSASAWGTGPNAIDAFQNWASHARLDPDAEQVAHLYHVRGFESVSMTGVRAEETISVDKLVVSGEDTNEIAEKVGDLELRTEEIIVESEVEDD